MAGLLKGVKVVEMAVLLTGDYTGMLLADQGADVIKVESPPIGDYLRSYMGAIKENWSAMHLMVNRNKRSLSLDLRKPEAQEVMRKLLAGAEVFVTGNLVESTKRLGLDYESVAKNNPSIVYCQATGFGVEGPMGHMPSHGMMMNALVGGTPVTVGADGLPYLDHAKQTPTSNATNGAFLGPIFAAFGVASALSRRATTGKGAYLDVSCADSVLAASWVGVNRALNAERIIESPVPSPTRETADYNYYRTADGRFIIFCPQEQRFWDRFCQAIERPDWSDIRSRVGSGMELRRRLQEIFEKQPQAYWDTLFQKHQVPACAVVDVAEIEDHPHLRSRAIIAETQHPAAGPFKMVMDPLRVAGEQFEVRHPAPSMGQHTDEVLAELGYSQGEIAALRQKGAV